MPVGRVFRPVGASPVLGKRMFGGFFEIFIGGLGHIRVACGVCNLVL